MTEIWAHRGASAEAPENTLLAFARAAAAGAAGVELDVQLLADGSLLVFHDDTFDRTTPGSGRVRAATLEQAVALRTGEPPQPIPTLAEVLQLLAPSDLTINIELKSTPDDRLALVKAAMELVDEVEMQPRVWWSSFDAHALAEARRISATAQLGLLQSGPVDWELARDFNFQAVHPDQVLVDRTLMKVARREGRRVHTWTVNDPRRLKKLAKLGVDVIITDDPRQAVATIS